MAAILKSLRSREPVCTVRIRFHHHCLPAKMEKNSVNFFLGVENVFWRCRGRQSTRKLMADKTTRAFWNGSHAIPLLWYFAQPVQFTWGFASVNSEIC